MQDSYFLSWYRELPINFIGLFVTDFRFFSKFLLCQLYKVYAWHLASDEICITTQCYNILMKGLLGTVQ